jgi:hypothetical protein
MVNSLIRFEIKNPLGCLGSLGDHLSIPSRLTVAGGVPTDKKSSRKFLYAFKINEIINWLQPAQRTGRLIDESVDFFG